MPAVSRQITVILLSLLAAIAVWRGAPPAVPAAISPRLGAAVAVAAVEVEHKVWVHFQPRALQGDDLAAALAQAEADLNPRAARRRARMHAAGELLVDVRDLPLAAGPLAACQATGARLHQQSRWLNAASFRATSAQVASLSRLAGVKRLDLVNGGRPVAVPTPVGVISERSPRLPGGADKTTTIDYGANLAAMLQANVVAAHDLGLSGEGVLIGLLDTGFRTSHEALDGIPVLAAWDFVNNDGNVDFETGDPTSAVNHGTMTLSTVAGNMPGQLVGPAFAASVVLAKTEDVAVEVPLEEDNWVAGLEWAEGLGADIISSSLGYVDWYLAADLDGNTAVTTVAADLAAARGLVVVNSAGNDRASSGLLLAPADADSVITVGAVDATGLTAWFSSPGPTADGRIKPDVAALGVNNTVASPTDDAGYLGANGTSFSCPLTAGVVALMLERVPDLTPVQVLEAVRSTASQAATPDNDQGWGIVNAAAAATWFGPVISHNALRDTSDTSGPYYVKTIITDRLGVDVASLKVVYRTNGGPWQELPLTDTGEADGFGAGLPGQPLASQVEYYVVAASVNGVTSSCPYAGAASPYTFFVTASSAVGDGSLPVLTQLGAAVPNPFNPQTMISFGLAAAGPTKLAVYDLRGRLVRILLSADLPAGSHAVRWDGRDAAGRAVGSGTYLYRLDGGGQRQQRKMQLVR